MTTKKAVIKTDGKIVRSINKSNEKYTVAKHANFQYGIVSRVNVKKVIESMNLDELLEASKLSNAYLHGEKISETNSTKTASYCSAMVRSKAASVDTMNNEINKRIVKLNEERYTPTKQSRELYNKFMKD